MALGFSIVSPSTRPGPYQSTWFNTVKSSRIRPQVFYDLQPLSKQPFDTPASRNLLALKAGGLSVSSVFWAISPWARLTAARRITVKCNNTSLPPLLLTRVNPFKMQHTCCQCNRTDTLLHVRGGSSRRVAQMLLG
jgi:hypothetical protein